MRKFLNRNELGPVILATIAEFENATNQGDDATKILIRERIFTQPLLTEYVVRNFYKEYIDYIEKLLVLK
jgi:hypothetical protein